MIQFVENQNLPLLSQIGGQPTNALRRCIIQTGEFTTIDKHWNLVFGRFRGHIDTFAQMVYARKEHTQIGGDPNVLHSVNFVDFQLGNRSSPHVQQMHNVPNDAKQEAQLDADRKADNNCAEPCVEITTVFSPQHKRKLKVNLETRRNI